MIELQIIDPGKFSCGPERVIGAESGSAQVQIKFVGRDVLSPDDAVSFFGGGNSKYSRADIHWSPTDNQMHYSIVDHQGEIAQLTVDDTQTTSVLSVKPTDFLTLNFPQRLILHSYMRLLTSRRSTPGTKCEDLLPKGIEEVTNFTKEMLRG